MARGFQLLQGVCLLCSLLTVGASGDDFCFLRLVFGPAAMRSHTLPLDDPNTDFLEVADGAPAGVSCRHAPIPCPLPSAVGPLTGAPPAPAPYPEQPRTTPALRPPAPLRC
jgi:hypothetical protein